MGKNKPAKTYFPTTREKLAQLRGTFIALLGQVNELEEHFRSEEELKQAFDFLTK